MNRMWLTPMAPTLPALHHTLRLLQAYSSHPSFQVRRGRVRDRGEEDVERGEPRGTFKVRGDEMGKDEPRGTAHPNGFCFT